MTSVRTEYREKRFQILEEIISLALHSLTKLEKRQLEKMSLPVLKKIISDLQNEFDTASKFYKKIEGGEMSE